MSARSCHFGGAYTRQVWKSRSVQFLRYSGVRHTDRHFSKPFTVTLSKGEGQLQLILSYWYATAQSISTCSFTCHTHKLTKPDFLNANVYVIQTYNPVESNHREGPVGIKNVVAMETHLKS